MTKIYHPNIDAQGRICLDTLNMPPKGAWKPSLNIVTVLASVQLLMSHPNADDGLMVEITEEFQTAPERFAETAVRWTRKYAGGEGGGTVEEVGAEEGPVERENVDDEEKAKEEAAAGAKSEAEAGRKEGGSSGREATKGVVDEVENSFGEDSAADSAEELRGKERDSDENEDTRLPRRESLPSRHEKRAAVKPAPPAQVPTPQPPSSSRLKKSSPPPSQRRTSSLRKKRGVQRLESKVEEPVVIDLDVEDEDDVEAAVVATHEEVEFIPETPPDDIFTADEVAPARRRSTDVPIVEEAHLADRPLGRKTKKGTQIDFHSAAQAPGGRFSGGKRKRSGLLGKAYVDTEAASESPVKEKASGETKAKTPQRSSTTKVVVPTVSSAPKSGGRLKKKRR